ncbi:melanopsin-like [Patiria miniata]|uniref:G-protein coupled receptors family 1 profile domain-containing protein n=1 Tax=Patiria miniata TaxID=46514 RepID=A0A913Z2G7_PATMI|nr:melanopsin-like [Patiria miniata]
MANETLISEMNTTSYDNTTSSERMIIIYQHYFERQIIAALFIMAAIVGTTGNSLVIIAVALSKKLRTPTNVFVVNLAIADLLACTALPWQSLSVLHEDGWPLEDAYWICVASASVLITCGTCSINNLALIAVTRWVGITKPKHTAHRMRSHRTLAVMVALTWLIPCGCVLVPLVSDFGELGYEKIYSLCSWDTSNPYSMYFNILLLAIGYPVQFVTIIFCYTSIFAFVRRNNREMTMASKQRAPSVSAKVSASVSTTSLRKKLWQRKLDVTKNLVYIVLAFAVSQTPYCVVLLLYTDLSYRLTPYFAVILFCNCCVNPIIYATSHPDFKEAFRHMIKCRRREIPQSYQRNGQQKHQLTSDQTESNDKL